MRCNLHLMQTVHEMFLVIVQVCSEVVLIVSPVLQKARDGLMKCVLLCINNKAILH